MSKKSHSEHSGNFRILDFRNRPPLPPYKAIFDLKFNLLNNPLKRELAVVSGSDAGIYQSRI
jgi:hypothetical protein